MRLIREHSVDENGMYGKHRWKSPIAAGVRSAAGTAPQIWCLWRRRLFIITGDSKILSCSSSNHSFIPDAHPASHDDMDILSIRATSYLI